MKESVNDIEIKKIPKEIKLNAPDKIISKNKRRKYQFYNKHGCLMSQIVPQDYQEHLNLMQKVCERYGMKKVGFKRF
jgi:hypothetical protein